MKVIVDKMPEAPDKCLFGKEHYINYSQFYIACTLQKDRKCTDVKECHCLCTIAKSAMIQGILKAI